MAKLTLYHAAPSRSSIVRWMLEEIGEPYDIHRLSLSKEDNRAPEYLAVNPMGKVPALRHGDVVITEAAAISAGSPDRPSLHLRERNSSMKNRKRETCTSGSVRDEDGNILIYSANVGGSRKRRHHSKPDPRLDPTRPTLPLAAQTCCETPCRIPCNDMVGLAPRFEGI